MPRRGQPILVGLIKIDLLGLGMLAALEETIPLIRRHEGKQVDLAITRDDPTEGVSALRTIEWVVKGGVARRPAEWRQR